MAISDERLAEMIEMARNYLQDDFRDALRELAALRRGDCVVVPREPTGEMWSAGKRVFVPMRTRIFNAIKADEAFALDDIAPLEIYRAMLASALPEPPKEQT